jgi:hypothetical protein
MDIPPAPTTSKIESESTVDDNNPPPLPKLSLGTAESSVDAGLTQADKEAKANKEQLAECEEFTMKLDNEYYNDHKILIELITESKKLLIKYKTGDNEYYYYLAEYISSVLDKPNCNNPSQRYKDYTDFLKDYRPTLKVKLNDKEEVIQLMDFQSVDGLKESIIPFNSGEKYLGDRGKIVGLNLPPVKDPKKRPTRKAPSFRGAVDKVIRQQSQVREVNQQQKGDDLDSKFGGKKRKKKKKKKRNNKTNRRKKKKNGTKKKRN